MFIKTFYYTLCERNTRITDLPAFPYQSLVSNARIYGIFGYFLYLRPNINMI